MSQILEAAMIICFGLSWPMNVYKSLKTRSTKGKSLLFLIFIEAGYICGIIGKIISDNITWVFLFYVVNFIMVAFDMVLYLINRKKDKKRFCG